MGTEIWDMGLLLLRLVDGGWWEVGSCCHELHEFREFFWGIGDTEFFGWLGGWLVSWVVGRVGGGTTKVLPVWFPQRGGNHGLRGLRRFTRILLGGARRLLHFASLPATLRSQ